MFLMEHLLLLLIEHIIRQAAHLRTFAAVG